MPEGPSWTNTDARLQQAFMAMAADAPGEIWVSSGWRSRSQQAELHRRKPNLAAAPGHSNHEHGLALDLGFQNAATRRWVHANAARYGLWFPMDYEPWHVQLIGVDRHNIGGRSVRGGGRNAFSQAPDGRFVNPYDALGGQMEMEDNTDPVTQFERLMAAVSSPDNMDGWMESPDIIQSPTAVGSPGPAAPDNEINQAFPGDTMNQEEGLGAIR